MEQSNEREDLSRVVRAPAIDRDPGPKRKGKVALSAAVPDEFALFIRAAGLGPAVPMMEQDRLLLGTSGEVDSIQCARRNTHAQVAPR